MTGEVVPFRRNRNHPAGQAPRKDAGLAFQEYEGIGIPSLAALYDEEALIFMGGPIAPMRAAAMEYTTRGHPAATEKLLLDLETKLLLARCQYIMNNLAPSRERELALRVLVEHTWPIARDSGSDDFKAGMVDFVRAAYGESRAAKLLERWDIIDKIGDTLDEEE